MNDESMDTVEDTTDTTESVEDRVSRLEYLVSRIRPELFRERAPFTNPLDDPDDPPASGTWEGHPWHGVQV